MGRVFISFLGTNDYVPCNYVMPDGKRFENMRFVQEALISYYCTEWRRDSVSACDEEVPDNASEKCSDEGVSENAVAKPDPGGTDRILIFLTSGARKLNWIDTTNVKSDWKCVDGQCVKVSTEDGMKEGLESRLKNLHLPVAVTDVEITEDFSTEAIWNIFSTVVDSINNEDEIWLDITHAFRFMPMLAMVMLSYLKLMKNITVRHIHYGAFEKLGPAPEVLGKPISERNAPVLELMDFHELQMWTSGIDAFVNFGNSGALERMISEKIKPTLAKTKGQDPEANGLRDVQNHLHTFSNILRTNKGHSIFSGEAFKRLRNSIENLKNVTQGSRSIPALNNLFDYLLEKVSVFKENSSENMFESVKWCIEKQLIQEGITQLQEGIVTNILLKLHMNYRDRHIRTLVNEAFYLLSNNKSVDNKEKEEVPAVSDRDLKIAQIKETIIELTGLKGVFSSLTDARNTINHGGFLQEQIDSKIDFESRLKELYDKTVKSFNSK